MALTSEGYTDLVNALIGNAAYSFVFNGRWGTLDYAMANDSLLPQVAGITEWHINADEPDALDYNGSPNPAEWYQDDAFRASDHDPIIVGLDLTVPQPDPIGDLAARAKSSAVTLTWTPIADATGYNVYRGDTAGGPYEQIAADHQTDYATYLDSGLAIGTYYYVVTYILDGRESAESNEAEAAVAPRRRR